MALRKVNEAFKSFNETAKASEAGKLYKLITTCLAVTTSVLTPIIELVVIFLPDLISLFCNPEEIKRRKIEEQLSSKIFPDIRGRVNGLVQDMLPELERDMRDALHGEWSAQIADVEKALIQAQEEKKQALSEADNQREQLDGDIHTLERMHHKLALVIKDL